MSKVLKLADVRGLDRAAKKEIESLAKYLVSDPLYLLDVQERLRKGTLHPTIQVMLWNYAFGKPKEKVEITEAKTVRIIHEFAETAEAPEVIDVTAQGKVLEAGDDHQ